MMIYFIAVPGVGVLKKTDAITVLIYPFIYFIIHTIVGNTLTFRDGEPAFNNGFINPGNYPNLLIFALVFIALVAIFGAFGWVLIQFKKHLDVHYYDADAK
jgi:H+/Cl- antiporter ClcA